MAKATEAKEKLSENREYLKKAKQDLKEYTNMLIETRADAKDNAILKIKLSRKVNGQMEVIEKLQA